MDGESGVQGRTDDPRQSRGEPPVDNTAPPKKRRLLPFLIFGAILVAGAVGGTLYWMHARNFASTDDAFIDGNISIISPRVAGVLTAVNTDDNAFVHTGDVLVQIDPRDYQVKLDQARAQQGNAAAQLEQAQAQQAVQQANYDQSGANVRVAEADLFQADQDARRFRAINPQAITRQQLDNASAAQRSAQAKLDAQRQAVAGAAAQVKASQAQVDAAAASLKEAEVQTRNAELQLSYTRVVAPVDGRITKRSAMVGNYVSAGTPLLSLVPRDVWVTANFKETQLEGMRPGQPVDISLDAFPSTVFHGHVDSFQSGTGSAFSTLPAENATGNYVKVVQRVPVKIVFDNLDAATDGRLLAPGMSVVPSVRLR